MRTMILLLLLSTRVLGQWAPDSLPLNQNILGFVTYNLGSKVGSGICAELVYQALGIEDSVKKSGKKGYELPLQEVDSAKIMPGDIVFYTNVVTQKGDTVSGHMGVVYFVCKQFYLLASQNTYEDLAHSVVVITHPVTVGEDGIRSVTSTFYRATKIIGMDE